MAKRYFTTSKTGEEVEVDYELAKSLIAEGKKSPEDFSIEEGESSAEMRTRAKEEYARDVKNLQNQEMVDNYGLAFPRAVRAETPAQAAIGGLLDIGSIPGRYVAGAIGATGSKLGGGDFSESFSDIMSRPGGDPNQNLGSQIIESAVKDPFAIPIAMTGGLAAGASKIPQIAAQVAKYPKIGGALLQGIAGGLENIIGGATERYAAPDEEVVDPNAMLIEGGLGTLLGGAGKYGADLLKGLGDTEVGRALLKKITPSKVMAGEGDKLASLMKTGFGVDIIDPKTGRPDARKLGRFLSEESRGSDILAESKYTRIPEFIGNEKERVGQRIGNLRELATRGESEAATTFAPLSDVEESVNALLKSVLGSDLKVLHADPSRENIVDLMKKAENVVTGEGTSRPNIISRSEIQKFNEDIFDLLPELRRTVDPITGNISRETIQSLDPKQLQQLNEFLYNAGKETQLKYHPSKEQYATALRELISEKQGDALARFGERYLPKQYTALSTLDELATKSPLLNPDRPSFMEGGLLATGGRKLGSVAAKVGELPTGAKRTAKEFFQSAIRTPSRTPQSEKSEIDVFRTLQPADQRVFSRAQERLRFDPNDREARQILNSYM